MDNYILAYYQAITEGTIRAPKKVKRQYKIIIDGIADGRWKYDARKAAHILLFAENYCRHHEGKLGGEKIKLELWQKAFLSVVFGIVGADGKRQFREVLLIVGRKNGKTLIAAIIAAYMTFLDGEYGARVYFCAPKLDQSRLCFTAFSEMISKEPALAQLAKKRRTDIYIAKSNSSAQPLAFSAKTSDGLNISCAICDELASWRGEPGRRFWEVLKSSFGAREQPLLVAISTAGYNTAGTAYDELYSRASRVLNGTSSETRLFALIYELDEIRTWDDVNALYEANPNLGVSISIDYMLEEIAIAKTSIPKKSEFLVKYCNIQQTASVAWLDTLWIDRASGRAIETSDFRKSYAVAGIDLSRTTDLTSACMVILRDGESYVFSHFWLPAEKLEEATARDRLPYADFVRRGELTLSGEGFVDYHDCEAWLNDFVKNKRILPLCVGYDRYCANYLIQDLQTQGYKCDDVFQGENLTPCIRELEGLMREGKIHIGDNQLLRAHLANAGLKINTETERCKLIKIDVNDHVDGVAAILDALIVRQKWWKEIGQRLENKTNGASR